MSETETNLFAYCSGKYQCFGIHHSIGFNSLDNNSVSDPALDPDKDLGPALMTLPLGGISLTNKTKIIVIVTLRNK